ncbi:MAG: hypothetical protein KKD48_04185 [Nanoarchaeota archaeon]|nr:hypothetical protein [Nanoarchaeota archaeon]
MAISSGKVNLGGAPYYEVYQFVFYLILLLVIIGIIYLLRKCYIKFIKKKK